MNLVDLIYRNARIHADRPAFVEIRPVSKLKKTGIATLPLHYGHAPSWLVSRMIGLADKIVAIIIDEYGQEEVLRRLANPFWFQALGCVLGYDWHSSGVTTVVTGVLKSVMVPGPAEIVGKLAKALQGSRQLLE
jgi:hypothetical protein